MLRYYGSEDLYYGIPCFDSMEPGRWSQMFRRHTLTFFRCAGVFYIKDIRNIFLRNVVTYLTNYTTSQRHLSY